MLFSGNAIYGVMMAQDGGMAMARGQRRGQCTFRHRIFETPDEMKKGAIIEVYWGVQG